MFRDEVNIEVIGGKGGDGTASFRREARVPRGGPDGGDGGHGGDVVLIASRNLNSLLNVGRRYRYAARDGRPGGPAKRTGKSASELTVEVPVGTQIFDAERGHLLRDLDLEGARVVVAAGGRAGLGNTHFANAVRQVPRTATLGREGERRRLRLELKLVAEVGLLGLPNAGKSTFLACVTAATPKIADYPFTTLVPEVGIAAVGELESLCIADLPGLIEGAAEGHGLGHRFLKHVERCSVLVHLVDVSGGDLDAALEAWRTIEEELARCSDELAAKPRLLVASKCEGAEAEGTARALAQATGREVLELSSLERRGLRELLGRAFELVRGVPRSP